MWSGAGPSLLSLRGLMFVDRCFAQLPRDLVTESSHPHFTDEGAEAGSQKPRHPPTVTGFERRAASPHHVRGPFPSPGLALVSWSDLLGMSI